MGNTFSRSWQMVKASFNVLRSDPELLVLPVISMLGVLLISLAFGIPLWLSGAAESVSSEQGPSTGMTVLGVIVLFLYYLAMYTVTIYTQSALVYVALQRLRGQNAGLAQGIQAANARLGHILGYAAISATVGVLLRMLRDRNNLIGNLVAGLVGMAWNVVTFLVVPVLVVENIGPVDAVKRSGALLRKTWGEQIVTNGGIGLVLGLLAFLLVIVIGGPLFFGAVATGSVALILVSVGVVILIVALVSIFGSALSGVFQAALYDYATTGNAGPYFDISLTQNAFRPRGARA